MSLLAALTSNPTLGGFDRNDFTGDVGFYFQTNKTLYIRSLGRWIDTGNSLTHTLKLWTGPFSVTASVVLNAANFSVNQYAYVALPTPLKVLASTDYYISSAEVAPLDTWWDQAVYTFNTDIASISAAFGHGSMTGVADNQSYVPVNFLYSLTPGGQTSQILG